MKPRTVDAALRHFCGEGDKPGTLDDWAALHHGHSDAGSWKSGETCSGSTKSATKMDPASLAHPHRIMKRIPPGVSRQRGEWVAPRIIDINGNLTGLQNIGADGSKRMRSATAKKCRFVGVFRALPTGLSPIFWPDCIPESLIGCNDLAVFMEVPT